MAFEVNDKNMAALEPPIPAGVPLDYVPKGE